MLLRKDGLSYHFYADDSQLYVLFKPGHLQANVNTMALENCIKDRKLWMIQNDLKLNTERQIFCLVHPNNLRVQIFLLLMLLVILWKENCASEILVFY